MEPSYLPLLEFPAPLAFSRDLREMPAKGTPTFKLGIVQSIVTIQYLEYNEVSLLFGLDLIFISYPIDPKLSPNPIK